MATSSQLPAHFLAYKQKAEEQANRQQDAPRMGNTNCWGASFSFMSADPRTSVSSNPTGVGSGMNYNNNDNMGFGSDSYHNNGSPTSPVQRGSPRGLPTLENTKIGLMWNSFSGRIKSTVAGLDDLEVVQTHSAELESKSGFPTNKQMTNVERLKSMAAASVRAPEIPDYAPELPPPPPPQHQQPQQQARSPIADYRKQSSFQSSSYPSLASSQSDGSSSLESSGSGGRFWNIGSKMFGKNKTNNNTKATGIGSHEDPSIGELNKNNKSSSYFPSSMTSMMTLSSSITKKEEEKKNSLDIDKLKKLRDQAAGLVPQSPSANTTTNHHHVDEHKEEEKVADTLESQIDDLEKEMGLVSTSTTTPATTTTPPHLRMDGFDDVHEQAVEAPPKNYAEIKVSTISTSAVSHLDKIGSMPKKMPSPLATFPSEGASAAGGLSTAL